ncbi:hypothetical protein N7495_002915 [Penicillium taxi]|uniref:uncharacterized protein n=1 Tax=Penicillium taxi TaxID=168475 RepID=UPI002545662A|nr:uncharacterized protein N7495_002915 [Penicillium taxi]KAJ5902387.1 hypothetical protein N7495_002915 [Penicillium taxi]
MAEIGELRGCLARMEQAATMTTISKVDVPAEEEVNYNSRTSWGCSCPIDNYGWDFGHTTECNSSTVTTASLNSHIDSGADEHDDIVPCKADEWDVRVIDDDMVPCKVDEWGVRVVDDTVPCKADEWGVRFMVHEGNMQSKKVELEKDQQPGFGESLQSYPEEDSRPSSVVISVAQVQASAPDPTDINQPPCAFQLKEFPGRDLSNGLLFNKKITDFMQELDDIMFWFAKDHLPKDEQVRVIFETINKEINLLILTLTKLEIFPSPENTIENAVLKGCESISEIVVYMVDIHIYEVELKESKYEAAAEAEEGVEECDCWCDGHRRHERWFVECSNAKVDTKDKAEDAKIEIQTSNIREYLKLLLESVKRWVYAVLKSSDERVRSKDTVLKFDTYGR